MGTSCLSAAAAATVRVEVTQAGSKRGLDTTMFVYGPKLDGVYPSDPLLFDKQGVLHVAVFTDMARVGFHTQQAPHTLRWLLLDVLRRVPGGYGVVVNPGTSLGFEISPSGIGELLKDFG